MNVGVRQHFPSPGGMPTKLDGFLMSGWFLMSAMLALLAMAYFEDDAVEAMEALFSSLRSQ